MVELVRAKPVPLDFTIEGRELLARKLPFRLAMELQSGEVDAQTMAEIIMACVVDEDDVPAFGDVEIILDWDSDQIIQLFQAVSKGMVTTQDAEKNLKAIQS